MLIETADSRTVESPLRERLQWRSPARGGADLTGPATMARAGAYFAAAGALLGLVAVAVPNGPSVDQPLLAGISGLCAVLSAALLLGYTRIPRWGFHAAAVVGTALASGAAYAWGTDSAFGPLPYLWIAVLVFFFFSLRAAVAHGVLMAAGYAGALALESPPDSPVDAWVATVVTLFATGLFVSLMRDRMVGLVARLTDAARRDALTDLLNRRGFEEMFDVELERTRRAGAPLSLILGDIDRFKDVNDRLGHAAGDEALRRIGRIALTAKRSFDTAARVGGEEFALLAPDCDEHGAYMLAERVRAEVERSFAASPQPVSMSFGIATFALHGQSTESLLRSADQALYAAKRLGRNRSVISSAEVPGILARAPRGQEERHVELATLLSLAEALDMRDTGNTAHCHRVGRYAELIARELGLAPDSVERVRLAGILHDVGRVGVPDDLLSKQGPLSEEEWAFIRTHPEVGARMVETTEFDDIRAWILFHHERPDGNGYPEGRPAAEVPLEARILAVADAYEAMTADRVYRPALEAERAAEELRDGAGEQFDPDVVEALLRVV